CGDGGFQMTAQALSTMARYGRNPIVVLIANGIYGFEQFLLDRTYFNINSNTPARPYAVIGQWDLVKLAGCPTRAAHRNGVSYPSSSRSSSTKRTDSRRSPVSGCTSSVVTPASA
ncbi:MAG TPA: thiamine pyrophosphate-dependent enzyme, partial [Mycobacterium sp.]|nr:thiamine pyrophosphate-dependent enzyme [Mycobacterium sp.]